VQPYIVRLSHHARNRYTFFLNKASKVGMLYWTWWLLTLARNGRLYRAIQPKLKSTCNLWMYAFLKLHHNCHAYMDIQKEWKPMFFTAFEQQEIEACSMSAAQYWYQYCIMRPQAQRNSRGANTGAQLRIAGATTWQGQGNHTFTTCMLIRIQLK